MSNALPLGDYLVGVAELAAISISLGYAALRLRAWLVPGWSGAPARLAEAIVWLALLISVAELLGALGVLEQLPLVGGCILIGLAVGLLASSRARRTEAVASPAPPSPPPGRTAILASAIAVAAVVGVWAIPTAASFSEGIEGVDSMWYHLPQSARFVQTGSVVDLHFTDPYFTNWFYPAHSELVHAVGMLAFERDLLSPLVNHGFLALGLLGAWCIGRPWGVGPQAMIGAAAVFAMEMTLDFQAGEARNDAAGLALFLASAGLFVNARTARPGHAEIRPAALTRRHRGLAAFGLAGLAAGLALGTKLSLVAPVAALTVGAIAIAPRGARVAVGASWLAALIIGGGFWYVRNAVYSGGNPLPWVDEVGPITLPAPEQAVELRPPFSVSHYLGDASVWREWFVPGLGDAIGPLWPVALPLVAAAAGLGLWFGGAALRRARKRRVATRPFEGRSARGFGGSVPPRVGAEGGLLAVLGAVAAITAVAYLFTPLTASGEEGEPVGFVWNLRYLAPALGLGLALLPVLPPLRRPPLLGPTLLVLLGLTLAQVATLDIWELGRWRGWAVVSAVAVLVGFGVLIWLRGRPAIGRPALALGAVLLSAVTIAGGYALQRDYLEKRYQDILDGFHLDGPIALVNEISDAAVATAGRGGVFFQYGFYGNDLSNRVQWLGTKGEYGAWLPLRSCPEWRAAINAGNYDYVVTTYDERTPGNDRTSVEREWIRGDPAAREVLMEAPVAIYELDGELDPDGCPDDAPRAFASASA